MTNNMNAADRAMELFEQKSPHQLAVELVAMQDRCDAVAAEFSENARQCGAQAELLREIAKWILNGDAGDFVEVVRRIDALLAGQVTGHPEQSLAMVPEGWLLSRLPQATPSQKEGGWTLEFEFLDSITDEVVARHGYDTSLEVVETVLVAVDAMLAAAPKPRGGG